MLTLRTYSTAESVLAALNAEEMLWIWRACSVHFARCEAGCNDKKQSRRNAEHVGRANCKKLIRRQKHVLLALERLIRWWLTPWAKAKRMRRRLSQEEFIAYGWKLSVDRVVGIALDWRYFKLPLGTNQFTRCLLYFCAPNVYSCHIMSYHVISCHIMSYHVSRNFQSLFSLLP